MPDGIEVPDTTDRAILPGYARAELIRRVAAEVPDRQTYVLVGIDGVDGSGKTTFGEIALLLAGTTRSPSRCPSPWPLLGWRLATALGPIRTILGSRGRR